MLGADDILDDAHWVNVQDPIKQMFLSITKALRVQASSIRDLDCKCNDLATKDQVQHQLHVLQATVCSKQDATQIIYQLENKIGEKEFATLQAKHLQAVDTISRLQDQLENQATTIQHLTLKVNHLETETEKLRNPNYDSLFAYMDRQITHMSADFERKISLKIDKSEVESVIPQKLEDLYRNINGKYHELKLEVQRTATKEELLVLAQNKADRNEVRDLLASDRETRLSKSDITSLINSQNKGLMSTIVAVEKNMSLVTQKVDVSMKEMHEQSRIFPTQIETLKAQILSLLKDEIFHSKSRVLYEAVSDILIDLTQNSSRNLGFMTKGKCETIMHEKVEFCLQQISIFQEQLRLEMSTFLHQDLLQMQGKINENLQKSEEHVKEHLEEKIRKLKDILKEFSQNVAKSLSKKVDLRDWNKQQRLVSNKELLVLETEEDAGRVKSGVESGQSKEFDELIKSMRSSTTNNPAADNDDDSEGQYDSHEESKTTSGRKSKSRHIRSAATSTINRSSVSHHLRTSPAKLKRQQQLSSHSISHSVSHSQQAQYDSLHAEIQHLKQALYTLQTMSQSSYKASSSGHYDPINEQKQQLDILDWRIALGELSTYFRTELAFKISKAELQSIVFDQNAQLDSRVFQLEKDLKQEKKESEERVVLQEKVKKIESELKGLGQKVMGELVGARFLWTNGQSSPQSFLLWDTQVINAAPSSILWRQGGREITVRVPGLYKITVAVFAPVVGSDEGENDRNKRGGGGDLSSSNNVVQVYLNDEPILSYQPLLTQPKQPTSSSSSLVALDNQAYYLKRFHHSMGEVTSLLIDEFVSLPPESRLSVRYFANDPAQAFMAIRKM